MRDAFVRALMREAAADPRLTLITGDLGFGVLKPFWETYPDQFVNAGIAEQGMTGLAAGLALGVNAFNAVTLGLLGLPGLGLLLLFRWVGT